MKYLLTTECQKPLATKGMNGKSRPCNSPTMSRLAFAMKTARQTSQFSEDAANQGDIEGEVALGSGNVDRMVGQMSRLPEVGTEHDPSKEGRPGEVADDDYCPVLGMFRP